MKTISGCYGDSITLSCDGNDELLVVKGIEVGSKPKNNTVDCSADNATASCCEIDRNKDCIFKYQSKVSSDKHEIRLCQGKLQECTMKVIWAQNEGKCPSHNRYPPTTNYMTINYKCANERSVMEMCGPRGFSKISNSTVHLRNYLYPTQSHSNRNCLCKISTVDANKSHTLRVKAIDVLFNCSHTLAFSDRSNNLKSVPCENALYGLSDIYSTTSKQPQIDVRYQTINGTNMYLWVEVSVDDPEKNAIKVVCQNMSEEYRMASELSEITTPEIETASKDPKLIGGVVTGILLVALLIVMLLFIWKRKKTKEGGVDVLRYSSDSNPYDNFKDNAAYQEEVYDTIPDNQYNSDKSDHTSGTGSVPNHAYESLKNNGYTQFQDSKKGGQINSTSRSSTTSLPKEHAPLPPSSDPFRRLPSLPKEDNTVPHDQTRTVLGNDILQSARSSTQTMLETLTSSNPDLSSRESETDSYSLKKSEPSDAHRGISTDTKMPSPHETGKDMQIDAEVKIVSPSNNGKKKIIPPPAIYETNE